MRTGTEPSRTSVLSKLTTMRLWMIGIFCLGAVQIPAPAAAANKTAGATVETTTVAAVDNTSVAAAIVNNTAAAAVETTTAVAGNNTAAAAVESTTAAAGNNTVAAAVETTTAAASNNTAVAAVETTTAAAGNNTVAAAVETTTAAAGNNTVKVAVNGTHVAAGNNTVKVAVNNTGVAGGKNTVKVAMNNTRVAAGKNTVKVAMNNTRVAAGKKTVKVAMNNTRVAAGIKIRMGVVKKNVKVNLKKKVKKDGPTTPATGSYTGAAGKTTTAAAETTVHADNTAAAFGVHERSLRRIRSIGNEPLNNAFAEKIKKWFKRLKDRIFGKKNEPTTPTPEDEAAPVVTLDKEDLLFIRRNPRRTNLNLTTLTLDPKRDWGFRLGRWLIIRKNSAWKKPDGRLTGGPELATPADDVPSEAPATAKPTRRIQHSPPYRHSTASPTPSGARATAQPMVTAAPRSTNSEEATSNPSAATATASPMMTAAPRSTKFEEATPTPEAPAEGTSKGSDSGEKKRDQSAEVVAPKE